MPDISGENWSVTHGDCRQAFRALPAQSVHCVVTSPPYWGGIRDYGIVPSTWADGWEGCYGNEPTVEAYVAHTLEVFDALGHALRDDGVIWWNIGDCYADPSKWGGRTSGKHVADLHGEPIGRSRKDAGVRAGNKALVPYRVALALQEAGWIIRQDPIWRKPAPMPESIDGWRHERHRIKVTAHELETLLEVRDREVGGGVLSKENRKAQFVVPGVQSVLHSRLEAHPEGKVCGSSVQAIREGEGVSEPLSRNGSTEGCKDAVRRERQGQGDEGSNPSAACVNAGGPGTDSGDASGVVSIPTGTGIHKPSEFDARISSAAASGRTEVQPNAAWEGNESPVDGNQAGENGDRPGDAHGFGMGDHQAEAQQPLCVLPKATQTDDGPCNPHQQGRGTLSVKRGSGLSVVQLIERCHGLNPVLSGDKITINCPGCDKCRDSDGYILRRGAWRPTTGHEFVFQIVKSPEYFCDANAAQEPVSGTAHGRGPKMNSPKEGAQAANGDGHGGWHRGTPDVMESRNPRSVWSISSEAYKGKHFAAFPTMLAWKCIQASTSAAGCCAACGSQYAPVVEKGRVATRPVNDTKVGYFQVLDADSPYQGHAGTIVGNRDPQRHIAVKRTTGYRPTCGCNAGEPVPCIVADPFTGSGTCLQVAINTGRRFVGSEIAEHYLPLIQERAAQPWQPKDQRKPAPKRRKRHKPEQSLFPHFP